MSTHDTNSRHNPRTPLDVHNRVDFVSRWKLRLGGCALVATIAWIGVHFALSEQRDFHASRGPVAGVHQIWNAECSACHVDFTPISSHTWSAPFLGDPKRSNERCQACHNGTIHHTTQTTEQTCGSCHREHRGLDASLTRLPDSDCTQCHKDLHHHVLTGNTAFASSVMVFSETAHPLFRSIAKDPGRLKFDHRRHLAAGMPLIDATGVGGGTRKLGDIPEPYRKRYRDQQEEKHDNAPVQLQCVSCHQLDAGEAGSPARSTGAYMLPITYDNHCQACHPLTVGQKVLDDPKFKLLTVPHRWQPQPIHEYLENTITAQVARGQAGFMEKKVTRPLPGKLVDLLQPTARTWIDMKIVTIETQLYASQQACALCHDFTKPYNPAASVEGMQIVPTAVPSVWFKHAKFNHTAHRAVQCAECHANAETSRSNVDVLIPDRDNCVQCHAPMTKAGTPGARHNCTECHLYHNGDHAGQGIGAAKRHPEKTLGTDGFLRRK